MTFQYDDLDRQYYYDMVDRAIEFNRGMNQKVFDSHPVDKTIYPYPPLVNKFIFLDFGLRGVGSTSYIHDRATDEDLIIVNSGLHHKRMNPAKTVNLNIKSVGDIFRGMRPIYRNIYFNGMTVFSSIKKEPQTGGNQLEDVLRLMDHSKQGFVLVLGI